MRHLTPLGWQCVHQGFGLKNTSPFTDEKDFWAWAVQQGSGFRLAAYLIIGMLGGNEEEFPGFDNIRADAHPVRMAWTLDRVRRSMISEFLLEPAAYIYY